MDRRTGVGAKVHDFFSEHPLKNAKKGDVLVQSGDDPAGIFYLLSGSVQEYDIADNGESVVVNVFKPPAYFPMSWAINRTPNQYFFEAVSDITYHLAPAEAVVEFLQDNPDVTYDLLARVYSGTDGLLRRMAHLMSGSARTRLLFELHVQALRFGVKQADGSFLVKLTEQELAARAGLSRETVSRELRKMKDLARTDREGIIVTDPAEIEKALGSGV